MTPDDPRHGEPRGYWAHHRDGEEACDRCKRAAARYQATRAHYGTPRRVSGIGTRRRIQALVAIGWTVEQIAAEVGYANTANIWKLTRVDDDRWIFQSTADKVSQVYERLCMTRPEGTAAHRSRLRAERRGWAPPLAWDDIDRDEAPAASTDGRRTSEDLIAEYEHLLSFGVSPEQARRRLRVGKDRIKQAYRASKREAA